MKTTTRAEQLKEQLAQAKSLKDVDRLVTEIENESPPLDFKEQLESALEEMEMSFPGPAPLDMDAYDAMSPEEKRLWAIEERNRFEQLSLEQKRQRWRKGEGQGEGEISQPEPDMEVDSEECGCGDGCKHENSK